YCAQPYFPGQIVFSPDNGQTIFAIDEINQRASKTIDYGDQGRQTSYEMINSLIRFQKIGLLNQSGVLQHWLESPPHRINGNQHTVLIA
ncbi:unnamed protein product, partial [Adineta steineri]